MSADTGNLDLMPLSLVVLLALTQSSAGLVPPGSSLYTIGTGFQFTEGPASDQIGNVYFTDQPNNRIMKWSLDGTISEWMKPAGRSNGLFFHPDGRLIACADEKNQLWAISPDQKTEVLVKDFDGKLLNGPNDVWVRADGVIYFTDPLYVRDYWTRSPEMQQPSQGVFMLAKGKVTRVDADFKQPNGIVGSADGKRLFVADIGAGKTYQYDLGPDGVPTNKRQFCDSGSDGMTLDEKGNVYLTGQGVTAYSPKGEKIWHQELPGWTANLTFGGKDGKLLFITAGDKVYGLQMAVAGGFQAWSAGD